MNSLEKVAKSLRHSRLLKHMHPLWQVVRPFYKRLLHQTGKTGLPRNINGTDSILILPTLHGGVPEVYEPEVWSIIMNEVRPGDIIADVGAYIGLYTIALAKRVGAQGKVYGFEPDRKTVQLLKQHMTLNHLTSRTEILNCVVGDRDGTVAFNDGQQSESNVASNSASPENQVQCVTLDKVFANGALNLLKIDVEGYEEHVLRGASNLLQDANRAPRVIFIEVHPFAWNNFGVSSESLLKLLEDCNYEVHDCSGNITKSISQYGEVIARRR